MEKVTLNNGVEMPVLGLGTYKSTDPVECSVSVKAALECGYRMIDTAQLYGNEDVVGKAIKESGIPRDEIFITTKIWCDNFSHARKSVMESLTKLGTDYIDLMLLHWPYGDIYAAWRDLEALYKEGVLRAIGVSNFNTDRLIDLINYNEIRPAVNQIETNLQAQRLKEHEWMTRLNVQHEGYMPFGQAQIPNPVRRDRNPEERKSGKGSCQCRCFRFCSLGSGHGSPAFDGHGKTAYRRS